MLHTAQFFDEAAKCKLAMIDTTTARDEAFRMSTIVPRVCLQFREGAGPMRSVKGLRDSSINAPHILKMTFVKLV